MNSFVDNLLSARASLIEEFAQQAAQLRHRVSQLDALLGEHAVDVSALPTVEAGIAPKPRRGRRPGSGRGPGRPRGRPPGRKKAVVVEAETVVAKVARKKAKKAAKKKPGRKPRNKGFNATGAVRALVADMKKPFTVGDLRVEFEKRHPGVLDTLNRIALSLALQSLGRKGEVTGKKDPNGKGNIFTRTAKLKA